ncbi:hypothetical protein [Streptomyces griseorubiginosus]|uniref:hypothetical protein n=1 Tax=Streptomyces griseorubiginosus TaxID=67304 RepID=UPI00076CC2E6|nr:hypothetical protein [Streptomyces griseorubiginosus]KUM68565.1 hypothetical protein AQI84_36560 [Streptomyces griseorubiginosus]
MFMRLSTSAHLGLAAAAALLLPTPPAPADPGSGRGDFPITTRVHGGPHTYVAGGGFGTWYLDLTNTTARTWSDIHPVVVLVDDRRALRPAQPRLEFYDGERAHPVRFEKTDAEELVGAFDDGFPGFTVAPGKTLTVRIRLALTADTAPNDVTVNAAVVQRHDDDGDWVGQSNDYRFGVESEPGVAETPGTGTATTGDARLPFADELARTGLGSVTGVALAATVALLATGGAILLTRRRR